MSSLGCVNGGTHRTSKRRFSGGKGADEQPTPATVSSSLDPLACRPSLHFTSLQILCGPDWWLDFQGGFWRILFMQVRDAAVWPHGAKIRQRSAPKISTQLESPHKNQHQNPQQNPLPRSTPNSAPKLSVNRDTGLQRKGHNGCPLEPDPLVTRAGLRK